MKTWQQLKSEIFERVFPAGQAPNLLAAHNKICIDAIVDLQTVDDCLQYDHTDLIPQCATLYNCGLTVFDAPRGAIKKVSVIDKIDPETHLESATADDDYCAEIQYSQVNPCHIESYLSRSRKRGCCLSIPWFFALPFTACGAAAYPPVPTDEGVPEGLPILPLGYHYPQTSTDREHGRAHAGVWAIERGKIFIAPWIQSTETVIVKWDGIKRTWNDGDPVDDDPLLAEAIEEYLRWKHADRYQHDEAEAGRAAGAYITARQKLIHQCVEETRVRDCEPSQARMGGASSGQSQISLYYNDSPQTGAATCPAGSTGDSVSITIPAGTVSSSVSVADANQKAKDAAQEQAEAQLVCTPSSQTFYNTAQTATVACQTETGAPTPDGTPVTITVPAGTVSSTVSQADANAKALAQAQAQAAAQLSCTFWNQEKTYTAHCPDGQVGADQTVTVPAHTVSSTISQADADAQALAQATNDANAALSCVGGSLFWNTGQHASASTTCMVVAPPNDQGVGWVQCNVTVTVIVEAHFYSSPVSVAAANQAALGYATMLAQQQAQLRCASGLCGPYTITVEAL